MMQFIHSKSVSLAVDDRSEIVPVAEWLNENCSVFNLVEDRVDWIGDRFETEKIVYVYLVSIQDDAERMGFILRWL